MKTINAKLTALDKEVSSLLKRVSTNPLNRHERRRNAHFVRRLHRKQAIREELLRRHKKSLQAI